LWVTKHTPEHTGKRVRQLIEGLKGQGITMFGATGYCYGGQTSSTYLGPRGAMLSPYLFRTARLTFDLAFENIIQAAVVAHPSLFKPEDLDVRRSQIPRVINVLSISR
jgi:dienelactone hydrolase